MISKGSLLKELIHAPKILITPGVYDGYSARLVQKMGFKAASISGPVSRKATSAGPTAASWGMTTM